MDLVSVDFAAFVERDIGSPARRDGRGAWWCCPFHAEKTPSFKVWQRAGERGHWHCFGACGAGGDAIDYIRRRENLGYVEAVQLLGVGALPSTAPAVARRVVPDTCVPPGDAWQSRACEVLRAAQDALWAPAGERARGWLNRRGFDDDLIAWAGLGLHVADTHDSRDSWGLPPAVDDRGRPVWVPRGVVVPWWIGGDLWRLNVRRPAGDPKYIGPAGWSNGLYGADGLRAGRPAVLVEGELDALAVHLAAGDLVQPVATGSTGGARRSRWVARLAACSVVLVAFDSDQAGNDAAGYWLGVLPRAKRWRAPWGKDAAGLGESGGDVRAWIAAGLGLADVGPAPGVVWSFPG